MRDGLEAMRRDPLPRRSIGALVSVPMFKRRHATAHRWPWALPSALTMGLALFLAAHHPLGAGVAVALLLGWTAVAFRWPALRLCALLACLPMLNLSPWTGWIGIEEFDIAVLGAAAAGFARVAAEGPQPLPPLSRAARWALGASVVLAAMGLWRGIADAGAWPMGWFQGYAEPLNAWRASKSWLLVLVMLPLLRHDWLGDRARAMQRLALGMLSGALVVALAVIWERAAYPGLFDIAARYRTTALFWEMHVGGAAVDAYVAAGTPFVAWALWAARTRWQWLLAAALSLLWAYAGVTTFSRGACLGAAVALLALGLLLPGDGRRSLSLARTASVVLGSALLFGLALEFAGYAAAGLALAALAAASWWRWRVGNDAHPRRRALAQTLLALVLVFECVVLVGPDSFMRMRLAGSGLDYESRRTHWMRGVGLLKDVPSWLWGLGAGRLPAHYDRHALRGEFPGTVEWLADEGPTRARVAGPRTRGALSGRFSLTQRVPLRSAYRLRMDVRSAGAAVWVAVCESHLLYNRDCQAAVVTVPPDAAWHTVDVPLTGPSLDAGDWFAPRRAVLRLSVLGVASSAEFDRLWLTADDGNPLLRNGGFDEGGAHWLPTAQGYYVPWHIDNLYLELLIERGLAGLAVMLAVMFGVACGLVRRARRGDAGCAFIAASLAGLAAVGLVSSVLDVPRVAWIGGVMLAIGGLCWKRGAGSG
jgi:hypothetical protein